MLLTLCGVSQSTSDLGWYRWSEGEEGRRRRHLALSLLQPLGDLPVESLHPHGEREGALTVLTVLAVVGEVTERAGYAGRVARVLGAGGTVAGPHSHQTAAQYWPLDAPLEQLLVRRRSRVAAVETVILTG